MSPRERSEREQERMRGKILDAVEELLVEEGIEKLSIRSIARRISYTPANLYHYYKDKDAILLAVLARGGQRIGAAVDAAIQEAALQESSSPLDALEKALRAYVQVSIANPQLARLVYTLRRPILENHQPGASERNPNLQKLGQLLSEAKESEAVQVDDIDMAARSVWIAAQGLVIRLSIDQGMTEAEREELISAYIRFIIQGIQGAAHENDYTSDKQ